jgi:hypothetical protein
MLTTFSVLLFHQNKGGAFASMGLLPRKIRHAKGLHFLKMMGSGKGKAFSLMPDFSRYCLLGTWNDESSADTFFADNKDWLAYRNSAAASLHFHLNALSAKGTWNKQQPFTHENEKPVGSEPLAVLTRASLDWKRLPSFWHHARNQPTTCPLQTDSLFHRHWRDTIPGTSNFQPLAKCGKNEGVCFGTSAFTSHPDAPPGKMVPGRIVCSLPHRSYPVQPPEPVS